MPRSDKCTLREFLMSRTTSKETWKEVPQAEETWPHLEISIYRKKWGAWGDGGEGWSVLHANPQGRANPRPSLWRDWHLAALEKIFKQTLQINEISIFKALRYLTEIPLDVKFRVYKKEDPTGL